MYYLKLSGFIANNKQKEFEQTYRFVNTQIPKTCEGFSISKDALDEGIYHVISYWTFHSELAEFSRSSSFLMLIGAFKTLGEMYENESGQIQLMQNQN